MFKEQLGEYEFSHQGLKGLSCIDKRSRNAPGQQGGSLQTRFIESMCAHVITIYGKRTGRP